MENQEVDPEVPEPSGIEEFGGNLIQFFEALYHHDVGNPLVQPVNEMLALEEAVLEENDGDEGIGDEASAVAARIRHIPAKDVGLVDLEVCTTIYMVNLETKNKGFSLCIDCYKLYAQVAPAAKHEHCEAHTTGRWSEVYRPMCQGCRKSLYILRPTSVCIPCNASMKKV